MKQGPTNGETPSKQRSCAKNGIEHRMSGGHSYTIVRLRVVLLLPGNRMPAQ